MFFLMGNSARLPPRDLPIGCPRFYLFVKPPHGSLEMRIPTGRPTLQRTAEIPARHTMGWDAGGNYLEVVLAVYSYKSPFFKIKQIRYIYMDHVSCWITRRYLLYIGVSHHWFVSGGYPLLKSRNGSYQNTPKHTTSYILKFKGEKDTCTDITDHIWCV